MATQLLIYETAVPVSAARHRDASVEVGANYALGPGIKVLGGVQYYNFSGPSNATAAQSWAILLGMDLRF